MEKNRAGARAAEDLFKASVTRGWSEQQNIGRRTPPPRPATKAIHRRRQPLEGGAQIDFSNQF